MTIKVKKMDEKAKLPYRATEGSAGADLFAFVDTDFVLKPGDRALIPTGIAIAIEDKSFGGFIFPRSSVASKFGVSLSNCVGVIDSDFRGELKIPVINHGTEPYIISNGDRIAQLVFLPVQIPLFSEDNELSKTERGSGGFGSTGK